MPSGVERRQRQQKDRVGEEAVGFAAISRSRESSEGGEEGEEAGVPELVGSQGRR